jgi:major inositol transporter-like SP family MFS transporter
MNFVVAMCFPPLLESIGGAWTFFVFAVLCVLSFVFVDKVIPETKNRSLPDIEEEFRLRYAEK